jgi:AcrR family transcriptional regulator
MTIDRSHKGLTRESVVRAAVKVVEEGGLQALTMRAVAKRLGSSPMSVYNHATDRDDLLVGMLEAAIDGIPFRIDEPDALARLTARYLATHDHLASRAWALQVLIRGDLIATNSFGVANACIGDLLELGLAPADAIYAHGVAWHLMLGELLDRHPAPPKSTPTQRELALRGMDVTQYPNYAHVLSVLDPTDAPPPCQFERTIALALPGVVERLAARQLRGR